MDTAPDDGGEGGYDRFPDAAADDPDDADRKSDERARTDGRQCRRRGGAEVERGADRPRPDADHPVLYHAILREVGAHGARGGDGEHPARFARYHRRRAHGGAAARHLRGRRLSIHDGATRHLRPSARSAAAPGRSGLSAGGCHAEPRPFRPARHQRARGRGVGLDTEDARPRHTPQRTAQLGRVVSRERAAVGRGSHGVVPHTTRTERLRIALLRARGQDDDDRPTVELSHAELHGRLPARQSSGDGQRLRLRLEGDAPQPQLSAGAHGQRSSGGDRGVRVRMCCNP